MLTAPPSLILDVREFESQTNIRWRLQDCSLHFAGRFRLISATLKPFGDAAFLVVPAKICICPDTQKFHHRCEKCAQVLSRNVLSGKFLEKSRRTCVQDLRSKATCSSPSSGAGRVSGPIPVPTRIFRRQPLVATTLGCMPEMNRSPAAQVLHRFPHILRCDSSDTRNDEMLWFDEQYIGTALTVLLLFPARAWRCCRVGSPIECG